MLALVRSKDEALNRFVADKPVHNLWDVRDRNAPVKKVIGFN
jgi:hypothetical protein